MIRSREVRERYWMMESVFATILRFDTITPRGLPVEPEVNISTAKSSEPTSGNDTESAPFCGYCFCNSCNEIPSLADPPAKSEITGIAPQDGLFGDGDNLAKILDSTNANVGSVMLRTYCRSSTGTPAGSGTHTIPARMMPR